MALSAACATDLACMSVRRNESSGVRSVVSRLGAGRRSGRRLAGSIDVEICKSSIASGGLNNLDSNVAL